MKRLIVFDLDGTLAPSKSPPDDVIAGLVHDLLGVVKVAVISGGSWPQFEKQLLAKLPGDQSLANLYLLPTCGTQFYRHSTRSGEGLSEDLSADERRKIVSSSQRALEVTGLAPTKVWGEVIEDRGSQITLSALGQAAPLAEKGEKYGIPDSLQEKGDHSRPRHADPEFLSAWAAPPRST